MKRLSLIILLIFSIVIANAQEPELKFGKKKGKSKATNQTEQAAKTDESSASSDKKEESSMAFGNATVNVVESELLQKAIESAFLVVKSSYNVRDKENGGNLSGNDFFGTVYSVVPLLPYGFGVGDRFLKPWKSDPNYDANKYGEDMVSVDKVEYKKVKDDIYKPYNLNKKTGESLAPGFFHVEDSSFQNLGLRVELGNGAKSGYMVWFYVNPENGETHFNVVPTNITFNENTIFNVRQPAEMNNLIGGAFLNLNADEPGCLRLNLMGIARIDPYGGKKWELVKMQSRPTPPRKEKSADPAKEEINKESDNKDDSIIPDQSNGKDKKKKSEKDKPKNDNKESTKSTQK